MQYHSTASKRLCEVCGKTYSPRPRNVRQGMGRYCSHACANRSRRIPITERFWRNVERKGPDECWLWLRATDKDGYGLFTDDDGSQEMAHRVAFRLTNGPIPDGISVLHHCDNPPCCNPAHLFSGTTADNNADKAAKGRAPKGSAHKRAKLCESDVSVIKAKLRQGISCPMLARAYGVSHATIWFIAIGRTWKHVAWPS